MSISIFKMISFYSSNSYKSPNFTRKFKNYVIINHVINN